MRCKTHQNITNSTINITILGRRRGTYTDGFTVRSSIKRSGRFYQQRDQECEFRGIRCLCLEDVQERAEAVRSIHCFVIFL